MKPIAFALPLLVPGNPSAEIERGVPVPSVSCEAETSKSYALYLPSAYDPELEWPLILAFDPSGSGLRPVEVLEAAAERYGYIVAGSNDSRNYTSWEFKFAAAAAVWRDVAGRFSIDPERVYTAGFSGGARLATEVALETGAVAGAFAIGGSFRKRETIERSIPFVILGASGTRDMNHREMQRVHARLLERELPTRHLTYDGPHAWAPADVCMAAVEWFEIQAIRRELLPRDPARLAALYEAAIRAARSLEDPYASLTTYEQITRDFDGLVDLADVRTALERLRADPAVERERKRHRRWTRHEDRWRNRLAAQMRKMEATVEDAAGRPNELRTMRRMLDGIAKDKGSMDRPRSDTAHRLVAFVATVGFERAVVAARNGEHEQAALFYEIALQADPESERLRVLLAGVYVRQGRFDRALRTLEEAVALGFADADRLRNDEDFEPIRNDPRFAILLTELASRSGPP
jgi:dienelactone hydrolase/Flp pilus assembly protein TadD